MKYLKAPNDPNPQVNGDQRKPWIVAGLGTPNLTGTSMKSVCIAQDNSGKF